MSAEKLDMDALQLKWWARKRSCLFGETFSSLEGEFPPDMEASTVQISTKQPGLRGVENGFKRSWDIIDLSNANWKVSANKEQMLFSPILASNADVAAKSADDPILWYRGRFYFNCNPIFSSTQWNRISTISSQFARKMCRTPEVYFTRICCQKYIFSSSLFWSCTLNETKVANPAWLWDSWGTNKKYLKEIQQLILT